MEAQNITAETSTSLADADLSVPKWPRYDEPSLEKAQIEKELKEVSSEATKWKSLYDKTQQNQKQMATEGLSDFQKKQKEIDLQHNETVSKIKFDIYVDRQQFLEKLVKIEDETIKEEVAKQQAQKSDKVELMQSVDINKKIDNDLVDVDADEERSRRLRHEEVEGEDGEGKYIDEDANNYQHKHLDIKHDVDDKYRDDLRVHGLTEEEWKLKQKKEAANLEELNQKEKELLEAQVEVTKAQHSLTDEKKKIDKEIKEKLEQNEKLKLEFEKRAAERQEAERRAAEERERAELAERQEEKNRRAKQLKQTEEIEQSAYELHEKEQELKKQKAKVKDAVEEVSYEIGKVSKDIEYTKKERSLAEKRRNEVQMRKAKLESELSRRKAKEDEELRHLKLLKEERRRHELKNSCKPSKVRTYACMEDGFRVIKYFDYKYDFDEDKCVEKVKRRTVKCSH